jgi:hypothetical protein
MANGVPQSYKERADRFYLLIGHCIVQWANVDRVLFDLLCQCIGPYEQAAIVYYRTPGLDVRLGLVDELVRSLLPKRERKSGGHDEPIVKLWKSTVANIKNQLLPVRRRIAHHPVESAVLQNWLLFLTRPDEFDETFFRIQASIHERMREKEANVTPLMIRDLEKHIMAVGDAAQSLHLFREKLVAHISESREPESPQTPEECPA